MFANVMRSTTTPHYSVAAAQRYAVLCTRLQVLCLVGVMASTIPFHRAESQSRPRARDLGIRPGIFSPGPLNSLTDLVGVRVGHATVTVGDSVRTGVTAIFPHGGNPFLDRVPAAIVVGNGHGKLVGMTQVEELGEIETPILLTCTL